MSGSWWTMDKWEREVIEYISKSLSITLKLPSPAFGGSFLQEGNIKKKMFQVPQFTVTVNHEYIIYLCPYQILLSVLIDYMSGKWENWVNTCRAEGVQNERGISNWVGNECGTTKAHLIHRAHAVFPQLLAMADITVSPGCSSTMNLLVTLWFSVARCRYCQSLRDTKW